MHAPPPALALADDVELLGVYADSGLREPPYLVRRSDGQVVQLSRLVFLVAVALDDAHDLDELAQQVSTTYGREVTAENVAYLLENKLRPAGLIHGPVVDRPPGTLDGARPLLALRMRVPLVPARAHRAVTRALTPLFWPPIVGLVLVGLVGLDAWLLLDQRGELTGALRDVVYQPQLMLVLTLLTIVAGAFHELGHAAAARYGGARPGAMGAGVYLVWPVFYTDVTDSYRLSRRGRLRTDLGGVYFNVLFALATTGLYGLTGFRPLLLFVVMAHGESARQFLPFVRLDGYYVVSDLAGIPNLFAYMRPVLVSLLPWHRGSDMRGAAQARLDELTPRARRLVTGWVCLTAPVLLVNITLLLVFAPRLAGAVWSSAGLQMLVLQGAVSALDPLGILYGVLGLVLLALPPLGIGYVVVRVGRRLAGSVGTWWQVRPKTTAALGTVAATVVLLQVALVWPDTFADAVRRARPMLAPGHPAEVAVPSTTGSAASPVADGSPPTGPARGDTPPADAEPSPPTWHDPTSDPASSASGDPASTTSTASTASPAATGAPPSTSSTEASSPPQGNHRTDRKPSPSTSATTVPPSSSSTTAPPDPQPTPLETLFTSLFAT